MIREATLADVSAILNIYAPYITDTAITFEYVVPTLAEFTARFEMITADFPWLVWEENGELLGYAYGARAFSRAAYQWDADMSIYLRQDCRGRGIGRQLYAALENALREQGYHLVYGIVTGDNAASCAFHRALGYTETGRFAKNGWKFGRWYDIIWYEKRLREEDPADPPIPWPAMRTEN